MSRSYLISLFFSFQAEIDACIERMSDENKVMRSEDTVFIIV